mmetsp:Transcript_10849/g.24695  ORF Transcript_10849/g.24695 Transcript_10849/m.24695 type:complete len:478 (-) Transcript_10849:2042-3475(-)
MGVSVSRRHIVLVFTTFVAIRSIVRIGYGPVGDSYIQHRERHEEQRFLSHPEGADAGGSIDRRIHDSGNTAPKRSFIDPSSQLFDLVQRWETNSSVTEEDAVQVLNSIVSSVEYINHKPSQGILFIKSHKTGSSTVSAALRSLATQHQLKHPVLTPKKSTFTWVASNSKKFEQMANFASSDGSRGAPFDVWAVHATYDDSLLSIVPTKVVVSIVRAPAAAMRSSCGYFHCCPANASDPSVFDNFVLSQEGQHFFNHSDDSRRSCELERMSKEIIGTGLNASALQAAGQKNKHLTAEERFALKTQKFAEAVERGEHILLVTERMSESMLLLWSAYSLHPLDVTYVSMKVNSQSSTTKGEKSLKADEYLAAISPNDSLLHAVANRQLDKRLEKAFGDRAGVTSARKQFETLNHLINHVCGLIIAVEKSKGRATTRVHTTRKISVASRELEIFCQEKNRDGRSWHGYHSKRLKQAGLWAD